MSEKRLTEIFTEIIAWEGAARDPQLEGVRSRILKLLTPRGVHVGTVHDIVNPDGSLRETHPHDYTRRDCSRVRRPEKQEPV